MFNSTASTFNPLRGGQRAAAAVAATATAAHASGASPEPCRGWRCLKHARASTRAAAVARKALLWNVCCLAMSHAFAATQHVSRSVWCDACEATACA